ncbi:MAG: hypothetical protein LBE36_03205 [Flavobacteriaceae bacterium]|jgi:hypothetical protein|nr:hypothetical protein [Flavobacteriaceae bacterium]
MGNIRKVGNQQKTKRNTKKKFVFPASVGTYFRELSVVVVGIAITVSIGLWINNRNSQKDKDLYLNAIKLELETNINDIEAKIKKMQISIDYADYLKAHDKESVKRDTLWVFSKEGGFNTNYIYNFKTEAFDMFKTSGMMRLTEDKDLLLSIWNIYNEIDVATKELNVLENMKFEETKERLKWSEKEAQEKIPGYIFYYKANGAYEERRQLENLLKKLKETKEKLE